MGKTEKNKKSNKNLYILFTVVAIGLIAFYMIFKNENGDSSYELPKSQSNDTSEKKFSPDFVKAVTSNTDSGEHIIRVSNPEDLKLYSAIDNKAGYTTKRIFTGRRINIILTGVDTRLGARTKHADANHVFSILIDSGLIEITSIPRDTPADAGLDDSTGQNKLTIVRALRGREEYMKAAAEIAGLDKIHYFVELGFSQAMGLLEFLGYKNSGSTLQILRSRTGLGGDDYQRCYNQSQFMKQMISSHFNKMNGILGEVIIRGGLVLVESNLTASGIKDLIAKLSSKGFTGSPDRLRIRVRPPINVGFKVYDFTDAGVINALKKKIENFNDDRLENDSANFHKTSLNAESILRNAIDRAKNDSAKRPAAVISTLRTYFDQKAWYQVTNLKLREKYRDEIAKMLYDAYMKKKQPTSAYSIASSMENEKKLFDNSVKSVVKDTVLKMNKLDYEKKLFGRIEKKNKQKDTSGHLKKNLESKKIAGSAAQQKINDSSIKSSKPDSNKKLSGKNLNPNIKDSVSRKKKLEFEKQN
ncbi:MAG: hypothetical protein HW421_621 [Ignavibacteria bacterium]|nr:hypothetical protein [Ignavibacteria bacterium]